MWRCVAYAASSRFNIAPRYRPLGECEQAAAYDCDLACNVLMSADANASLKYGEEPCRKRSRRSPATPTASSFEFAGLPHQGQLDGAPSAYLQAALHGGELPGVVAIDALMPKLRDAEAEGRVLGDVTIVPSANPIGRAQYHVRRAAGPLPSGHAHQFQPRLPADRPAGCGAAAACRCALSRPTAGSRRGWWHCRWAHDIVLDLHCDDEGVPYLYVPAELWPAMADCAAALGVEAVLTWQDASDGAFEEAAIHPYLASGADLARPRRDHRRAARHRRRRARLCARGCRRPLPPAGCARRHRRRGDRARWLLSAAWQRRSPMSRW